MKKITYVLALETSSEHLSVCLWNAQTNSMTQKSELAFRHLSDQLHPFIEDVLSQAKVTPQEVDLLACTRGPGSFTSVRVGLAALKGFKVALGIDAVTLSSLELVALPHLHQQKQVCVWLECHGGNVYTQLFNAEGEALASPASMKAEAATAHVPEGAILVGSGVIKHPECVPSHALVPERETSSEKTQNLIRYGDALRLAKEAYKRYEQQTLDVNNMQALYVHPLNYDKVGAV